MSIFEKLVESAKNEMAAALEQAYSIEMNKRETQFNELRAEITRLKAIIQDITTRNCRLEMEKKVFDDYDIF